MGLLDEIYPKLFAKADLVFPEFQFIAQGGGWVAAAKRDLDGSETQQGGKVYIYRDRPYRLWSHRLGEGMTFWGYLAKRDGFNPQDKQALLHHLAQLAGLSLPAGASPGGIGQAQASQTPILQAALDWMHQALATPAAAAVQTYLRQQRGYSRADIEQMQLGFLPSQGALEQHLASLGYARDRRQACLRRFHPFMGRSHRLMIPIRSRRQQLIGFCSRTIIPTLEPKYLNSKGLDKTAALFDYPFGSSHLVLVEGVLDAAIAKARGMAQVVPLLGSSLSLEQLRQLQAEGIQAITLCLDGDRAGAKARKTILERCLTQAPQLRLRIAMLPGGHDPDALIRSAGLGALQSCIDQAEGVGAYCGRRLAEQISRDALTAAARDRLLLRCAKIEHHLSYPPDRYDFQQHLHSALAQRLPAEVYAQTLLHLQQAHQQASTTAQAWPHVA